MDIKLVQSLDVTEVLGCSEVRSVRSILEAVLDWYVRIGSTGAHIVLDIQGKIINIICWSRSKGRTD